MVVPIPRIHVLLRFKSLFLCCMLLGRCMSRVAHEQEAPTSSAPGAAKIRGSSDPISLFLLGDSTTAAVIQEGLRVKCKGILPDPRAVKIVEEYNRSHAQPSPYLCQSSKTSGGIRRIGFSLNWGVSSYKPHYHTAWATHRAPWRRSSDSVAGIFEAVAEFQNRSLFDPKAVFVFLSNFWDAYAYEDHKARVIPPYAWLEEFKANYTKIVLEMKRRMRPGVDCLVLQTIHAVGGIIHTYSLMINEAVKEIASELGFPSSLLTKW